MTTNFNILMHNKKYVDLASTASLRQMVYCNTPKLYSETISRNEILKGYLGDTEFYSNLFKDIVLIPITFRFNL